MSIPFPISLSNVELIVEAFSDKSFQRKAWVGEISTGFGSPDEMMCVYFDDVKVPEVISENAELLTESCKAAESALTELLNAYPWPMQEQFIDALALLEQKGWSNVCGAARSFLVELRRLDTRA